MVSTHVQTLDERPGVRLLNRTTRKINLTEVGETYYDRATQILSDLEHADHIAGAQQLNPRGTLRVYSATHIIPFIAPAVAEFLLSYPEVKVDLTMGERAVDLIDEGYDVAIRHTPPPDSSLIVRRLATWQPVLCCSPSYLEKHGPLRQLAQLAKARQQRYALLAIWSPTAEKRCGPQPFRASGFPWPQDF
jgi:DNA-binding transcriptional LysR family regulator